MTHELSKKCLEHIANCLIDSFEMCDYKLIQEAKKEIYQSVTEEPVYNHEFIFLLSIYITKKYLKEKINDRDKENSLCLQVFSEFLSILNYRIHSTERSNYAEDFNFDSLIASNFMFIESSKNSEPRNSESSSFGRQDDWGGSSILDFSTKLTNTKQ
jgi:hypothetical protein